MSASVALSRPVPAAPSDAEACRAILAEGSKSFATASLILPARLRDDAAAIYAFCRIADDAVDLGDDIEAALVMLNGRLDAVYAGTPINHPMDRAFCKAVERHAIPRGVIDALLEGFAWDGAARRYETLEDLTQYCARVASSVGVMMSLLMGVRDRATLARACDLGLAMQLTNIARDVGEDARAGRVYLPLSWLTEAGLNAASFGEKIAFDPATGQLVSRLLAEADLLYRRADIGIAYLPADCRFAITAARLIYSDIGRVIEQNGFDSVSQRASTSTVRKIWLLAKAFFGRFRARQPNTLPPDASVSFLLESL